MECDMQYDQFAAVILDEGLDRHLDYGIKTSVTIGSRVLVTVQNSLRKGTVVAIKNNPSVPKVQSIQKVLSEESFINPKLFALAKWMSRYYCTSFRKSLKALLPATIRKETKEKKQLFVRSLICVKEMGKIASSIRDKYPSQGKILDVVIKKPKGILLSKLLEFAGTSKSPVLTLEKQKILRINSLEIDRSPLLDMEFFPTKPKTLQVEQKEALDRIISHLKTFKTHLIYGVTGSGKTEIYLQAIAAARNLGLGVILLVPEIALKSQTIERLKSRC